MTNEDVDHRGRTLIRRMRLALGESTPWHRDPFVRVTTVISGDVLAIEFRDGGPVERVLVTKGQATFEDPVDRVHRAVNAGSEPYEEVSVFFLDRVDAVAQPGESDR
jgi:quercetin dioxygenase-like cupin family protein